MWKSAFAIVVAMTSGAASAQDTFPPDPQKIDSMTRNCVYNSAFYSQGAIICLGGARGLQCTNGSWIATQDINGCKDQIPVQPPPR
jgi:hypothetical protein